MFNICTLQVKNDVGDFLFLFLFCFGCLFVCLLAFSSFLFFFGGEGGIADYDTSFQSDFSVRPKAGTALSKIRTRDPARYLVCDPVAVDVEDRSATSLPVYPTVGYPGRRNGGPPLP